MEKYNEFPLIRQLFSKENAHILPEKKPENDLRTSCLAPLLFDSRLTKTISVTTKIAVTMKNITRSIWYLHLRRPNARNDGYFRNGFIVVCVAILTKDFYQFGCDHFCKILLLRTHFITFTLRGLSQHTKLSDFFFVLDAQCTTARARSRRKNDVICDIILPNYSRKMGSTSILQRPRTVDKR